MRFSLNGSRSARRKLFRIDLTSDHRNRELSSRSLWNQNLGLVLRTQQMSGQRMWPSSGRTVSVRLTTLRTEWTFSRKDVARTQKIEGGECRTERNLSTEKRAVSYRLGYEELPLDLMQWLSNCCCLALSYETYFERMGSRPEGSVSAKYIHLPWPYG